MFQKILATSKKQVQTALSLICSALILLPAQTLFAAEKEEDNYYNLDEVVVTATRTEKPRKEVANSVSVITREMIDKSPETTIVGMLARLPGVTITNTYGNSYGNVGAVTIRQLNGGGMSNKLLVLLDGRPVIRAFGGGTDLNLIPLDNVERIEVVRGPVSAMYGDTALSGAINVITRKPEKDAWSLNVRGGSFGTYVTSLTQEHSDGKVGYLLTADSGHSDGFRPWTDAEGSHYSLRLDYDNDLIFRLGYNENNYNNPAAVNTPAIASPRQKMRWTRNWNEGSNYYFDVEKKFVSGDVSTSVRAYLNNNEQKQTYFGTAQSLNLWMEDSLSGVQLQQSIRTSDKQTITWGGDYRWLAARNLLTNKDYPSAENYALYVQADQKFDERWIMNVGGRYDHHTAYGGEFSPKFGLVYMARPDTAIKLNVAHAFKAPTLSDLYGPYGNPDLKPSTVWDYELGVEKQFNANTRGSLVFYKMDCVNDIINNQNMMQRSNLSVEPQGIELEFTRKVNEHVDYWVNYTYVDAGEQTFYLSRHKANAGVTYRNGRFQYNLSEKYVDSTWTAAAVDNSGNPQSRGVLAPYLVTDLKIIYTANARDTFTFGVENMFNRQYEVLQYYPMPGRAFTFTFTRKG